MTKKKNTKNETVQNQTALQAHAPKTSSNKRSIAVAMALTGGKANAAILLNEIIMYMPYSKAEVKDRPAIVQTDDDLMERTGMSYGQVRRTKTFLSDNGLIQTTVKNSQFHQQRNATFIWLSEEMQNLWDLVKNNAAQVHTNGSEQDHINQYVQNCTIPLYIKKKDREKIAPLPSKQKNIGKAGSKERVRNQLKELEEMFEDE